MRLHFSLCIRCSVIQQTQQFAQFFFKLENQVVALHLLEGKIHLLAGAAKLLQALARAFNGVFVFVEQAFDQKEEFDVVKGVSAAAGAIFFRPQFGKFRLPITQNVGFERGELADFADRVVKLLDLFFFHGR